MNLVIVSIKKSEKFIGLVNQFHNIFISYWYHRNYSDRSLKTYNKKEVRKKRYEKI